MLTLRNIDLQTLAALLLCEARSHRARSSSTEDASKESGAGNVIRPCWTVQYPSRRQQTGPQHTVH